MVCTCGYSSGADGWLWRTNPDICKNLIPRMLAAAARGTTSARTCWLVWFEEGRGGVYCGIEKALHDKQIVGTPQQVNHMSTHLKGPAGACAPGWQLPCHPLGHTSGHQVWW